MLAFYDSIKITSNIDDTQMSLCITELPLYECIAALPLRMMWLITFLVPTACSDVRHLLRLENVSNLTLDQF